MLVNIHRSSMNGTLIADGWWQVEGQTAGYIKWWRRSGDLRLSDIEVREDWWGRGAARAMIAAVEQREALTMHSSGSFTRLGYAALARHLPSLPGTRVVPLERMTSTQGRDAVPAGSTQLDILVRGQLLAAVVAHAAWRGMTCRIAPGAVTVGIESIEMSAGLSVRTQSSAGCVEVRAYRAASRR